MKISKAMRAWRWTRDCSCHDPVVFGHLHPCVWGWDADRPRYRSVYPRRRLIYD